jgi:hypothetical protein
MSKLLLPYVLLLLTCIAHTNADPYAGAIKALQYINAKSPIMIVVVGGISNGRRGFWVGMDNNAFLDLLIPDSDVSACGFTNTACIYRAWHYFKQAIELKGYKMQGFTDLTIKNSNPRVYGGRVEFLRFIH